MVRKGRLHLRFFELITLAVFKDTPQQTRGAPDRWMSSLTARLHEADGLLHAVGVLGGELLSNGQTQPKIRLEQEADQRRVCLLYTSPSPRD